MRSEAEKKSIVKSIKLSPSQVQQIEEKAKEKNLTFDKAKQQVDLELHTGDELKVISLDDQYNYFAMYQIQQYDE